MESNHEAERTTLAVAFRAYLKRIGPTASRQGSESRYQLPTPNNALVFDCETTIDATQELNFGFFRWLHRESSDALWRVQIEGCFYADDLADREPEGFDRLRKYCARATADGPPPRELLFVSHQEFLRRFFLEIAYTLRGLVVGFNLPFDLTRIARWAGVGRRENAGAFSLILATYHDPKTGEERERFPYYPRVIVRPIDSTKAFINFAKPGAKKSKKKKRFTFRGRFLDLRSLVHALTGRKVSLAKACELLDTTFRKRSTKEHGTITRDYIEYARDDVRATQDLFEACLRLLDTHPVNLDPCKAFSPASLAKAYFRAMGLTPLMRRFGNLPDWLHGAFMAAFFGGRAEVNVRKAAMPVVHTDFKAMYPTVNALLHLHEFLIAERVEYQDATNDVRSLCESVTVDDCFEKDLWSRLRFVAEIVADRDIMSARARYGDQQGFGIGVNKFTARDPVWITGPDLVALVLLGHKVPVIKQAVRLFPRGVVPDLRPVNILGEIPCDPARDDFFKLIVEQRIKVASEGSDRSQAERDRLNSALKVLASSGAYGVFVEANLPLAPPEQPERVLVFGNGAAFEHDSTAFETPGPYFFPPMAALITAGARLMLALLERLVTDKGSRIVFCDTDSGSIVATRRGAVLSGEDGRVKAKKGASGSIVALSWETVDHEIVGRFGALNPYDPTILPGSILQITSVNFDKAKRQREVWCYAIAAKRYAFFVKDRGQIRILDDSASEHGLGHLLDPYSEQETEVARDNDLTRRWIVEVWDYIVRLGLGLPAVLPAFARRPAVTKLALTTPLYWTPFMERERSLPYAKTVKPCGFVISGHIRHNGHPVGADATRFHVVQPFSREPEKWLHDEWLDIHSGESYRATLDRVRKPHAVTLKTVGDVIEEYIDHPEAKFYDARGRPCAPTTVGLLRRRHVVAESTGLVIGKEANRIEEVESGVIHDWEEVQPVIVDPTRDPVLTQLVPALGRVSAKRIAKAVGRSVRQAQDYRTGKVRPPTEMIPLLRALVGEFANS